MARVRIRKLAGGNYAVEAKGLIGWSGASVTRGVNSSCHPLRFIGYDSKGSIGYGSFCVFPSYKEARSSADEIAAILGIDHVEAE